MIKRLCTSVLVGVAAAAFSPALPSHAVVTEPVLIATGACVNGGPQGLKYSFQYSRPAVDFVEYPPFDGALGIQQVQRVIIENPCTTGAEFRLDYLGPDGEFLSVYVCGAPEQTTTFTRSDLQRHVKGRLFFIGFGTGNPC